MRRPIVRKELVRYLEEFASNDNFWNILQFLDSLKGETSLHIVMERCYCTEDDIHKVLDFLNFFKYEFQCKTLKNALVIIPPTEKKGVCIEMSLPEWFAFQAQFPQILGPANSKSHRILTKRFFNVKRDYSQYDLSCYLEYKIAQKGPVTTNQFCSQVVEAVENAINDETGVGLFLKTGNTIDIYPHRVVFLEERHSVIGEELEGKNLISFSIDEIEDIRFLDSKNYVPNFSQIEVDDFISALRAVSGNEKRLILKIINSENVNLSPDYHYFGNPYLTTNSNGDLLWAASVEISDDLFEWLYTLKDNVAILEDSDIQNEYEEYKERRKSFLKRVA